jgi:glutamine synthetase
MELDQILTFRVAACDLNGQMRGKRLPISDYQKLDNGLVRMPLSVMNVDVWGADIIKSPLVFDSGDQDGVLFPTERGSVPMPWLSAPTVFVPMWMYREDGTPFEGDPRHALAAVLKRYAAHGWTVTAATELEFYLVDDSGDSLAPPINPLSGRPVHGHAYMSLRQLDAFDAYFTELYQACASMNIDAKTAISEAGLGQFEINLNHTDAMRMADDTWMFKALVRGLARKHGMAATFMAKPFLGDAGNGMHMHFSVTDKEGKNIFDDGTPMGTDALRHAVAGCLNAMPASTLVFAPHGNSFERLTPGSHAPTGVSWGYENRTAALRIPAGNTKARRIEHRVACGDINPYLLFSLVLGAALVGIEEQQTPPAAISGNAYAHDVPRLPTDWSAAIAMFKTDPMIEKLLPRQLIDNFCLTKEQELERLRDIDPSDHWKVYLETV